MLINLEIENWMSYKGKAAISLSASREQQHSETLAAFPRLKMRFLPIAMMFGGNASGKSNFFKALAFCKSFVQFGMQMQPEEPIAVEAFRLDAESEYKPTRFSFSILVGNDIYDYSFAATRLRVTEEKFSRRTSPAKDLSYSRVWDNKKEVYDFTFGKAFDTDLALAQLISRSVRENQLYLSVAASQNLLVLLPVYNWFAKTLRLISPVQNHTTIERYADKSWPASARVSEMLREFDTGIAEIRRTRIQRSEIPMPPQWVDDFIRQTREGMTLRLNKNDETMPYLITRLNGELIFEKLTACHKAATPNGETAEFELSHESEGTQRILDLLPALVDLESNAIPHVFVIDEIDLQLHTMATQRIIKLFTDSRTKDSRSQILATTHDLFLMDQSILRRDEMWLAERNPRTETSKLVSVNDFLETRKNLDLRKFYLSGRMGGIPSILTGNVNLKGGAHNQCE